MSKLDIPSLELAPIATTRRRFLVGGAAVAGAMLLGACGGDEASSAPSTATGGAGQPPEKPAKIVMRAWGEPYSTTLAATGGAAFTAKTGIPVEFDLTDFAEMKVKIEQAVKAGQRPFVDLAYTTSPDAYVASARGYAAPLDTNLVTNFAQLTSAGKPDDNTTNWVNIYTYTVPVLYREDLVTFPAQMSIEELWDPKYTGNIGLNLDPNIVVWPLSKAMGLDPATDDLTPLWDKVAELKPNIGAIWSSDTELLTLINSGDVAITLGLAGNVSFIDNGAIVVPTEGAMLSADSLYIPTGLPDNVTYWAQVLVNEMIDAKNETAFCDAIAAIPTNSGASPPASLAGQPAFPFTDEEIAKYAVPVINSVYAENRDAWIEAMTNALQG
ncbi:MAG: PotD/PotF family extracellular solute-binding protein [Actinomycetota bacterium]